ncbi:MAG: hypothetical protein JSS20_17810 [Proteobacteria bacterium]|nr:hypothetical protein [Pseudomonadota bacterium]
METEKRRFSGGIATFMPLFRPPTEMGLFLKQTWTNPKAQKNLFNVGPFEWGVTVEPPQPDLLPTTVLLGDSFADALVRAGFPTNFNALWRHRWGAQSLAEVVAGIPSDTRYVILDAIEVNLNAFLQFRDEKKLSEAIAAVSDRFGSTAQ